MKNIPAKIISIIFHPLLLSTYAMILFFIQDPYLAVNHFSVKKYIVISVFLLTFIFPFIFLLILLILNMISNLRLEIRSERFMPFILALLPYIMTYFLLIKLPVKLPFFVTGFIIVAGISVFISMIINFITKISVHMVGIMCFSTYMIIFLLRVNPGIIWFIVGFIVLVGIVATSRLSLNAHKPFQIYLGLIVGFFIGLSGLIFRFI